MMEWLEDVFFTPDGANLEYTVAGTGRKLLFLPDCGQKEPEMQSLSNGLTSNYELYRLNRRGWGNSAPKGSAYSLRQDCQDVGAFMEAMGISCIFALGYAGLIAIQLSIEHPDWRIVLFDPCLPELRSCRWLPRMKREVGKKDYTHALITYMKGTFPKLKYFPRFALHLMLNNSFIAHDRDKEIINETIAWHDPEKDRRGRKAIAPDSWKQTMKTLECLVEETEAAHQAVLPELSKCCGDVLLYSHNDSPDFVEASLRRMLSLMPHARWETLDFSNTKKTFNLFTQTLKNFLAKGTESHV